METAELLKEFHDKYAPVDDIESIEQHWEIRNTRRALLVEEYKEYIDAELSNNFIAVADALGDLVYVCYGTALCYGIDLDDVLEEIHRSNMSKDMPKIAGGKAIKGANYSPPDIRKVLGGRGKD